MLEMLKNLLGKSGQMKTIEIEVPKGYVLVKEEEYDALLEDRDFLLCLQACGVDNWEGIEEAIQMFKMDD